MASLVGTPTGAAPTAHSRASIHLISVSSTGERANGESEVAAVSAHGRHVVVASVASNLVPGDTNASGDVFVRDVRAGTTTRVSVSSRGTQGNAGGVDGAVSADGRYVMFTSVSSNLVPGDTNGWGDVFVRDLRARTTTRVSVSSGGAQGDFHSWGGTISADGRRVAFMSEAANLVPGDTNRTIDLFVRDLRAGTTTRLNVSTAGAQADDLSLAPMISADGRYVAFVSDARNLVPGDTNGWGDVFVRDLRARTTTLASVSSDGSQSTDTGPTSEAPISGNGRYVTFSSSSTTLAPEEPVCCPLRIFLRDRRAGTTRLVAVSGTGAASDGDSFRPSISTSGRYVAFDSSATDLTPGDANNENDIFVRDLRAGVTHRVNMPSAGVEANGTSYKAMISGDGRHVAFNSYASNLVPDDTNGVRDVFLSNRISGHDVR
jgi:Tol biopolymer transport system component